MRKTNEPKYDFSSPDLKKQQDQSHPRYLNAVKSTNATEQVLRDDFVDATDQLRNDGEPLSSTNVVGFTVLVVTAMVCTYLRFILYIHLGLYT